MPIDVRGPDGIITRFPDGTPEATIDRVMAQAYRRQQPRDTSFARGVALGAAKPVDNLATAVSNIPVIGPALDAGSRALGMPTAAEAAAANQQARANNTRTGGQIVGNIIGTLPTAALPGGALAQGATSGALLSDADTAAGVAGDALIGAGAGQLGSSLVSAARNVVAPRVSAAVRQLADAGVQMTPGQIIGGPLRAAENVIAAAVPVVGDAIQAAQRRSVETFNIAAVNRALSPLGLKLPANITPGNEAVKAAGDALSEAYERVLPALSGQVDDTFVTRVSAIAQRANLPPAETQQFQDIIRREIGNLAQAQNARFTGRMLNQVRDRLDKVGAALRANTQSPYARELGEAVGQVREQVLALARRQNPTAADALRRIDRGWAELVRVERAAANAVEGVFTPGQFSTAVRGADRSVRRRAVARGEALGQDFANAARTTLPSVVPNSGTPRQLVSLAAGGGAIANPGAIVPAIGAGAATMAAYSAPATRAFQQFVTRTPGPAANFVNRLLGQVQTPISVAAPALLRRREQ